MKELNIYEIENISGAGDVNWVQVGRDVVTDGAGALYDLAGHSSGFSGIGHAPMGVTLP